MAKYDWKNLEKEYILSNYKSVSAFLKDKDIKQNGSTKKSTKGWKNKKVLKEEQKSTKTIEKTIEKQSEKEAQQIVDLKSIATDLALNVIKANKELNRCIAKSKTKIKKIKYNGEIGKPSEEETVEEESVNEYVSIIDRQGLKMLTSALKDLSDVMNVKSDNDKDALNKLDKIIEGIQNEAKQ